MILGTDMTGEAKPIKFNTTSVWRQTQNVMYTAYTCKNIHYSIGNDMYHGYVIIV